MRLVLLLFSIISIVGCKQNSTQAGSGPINYEGFSKFFPEIILPYVVTDSTYNEIPATDKISREIFEQFVPDSVLASKFGKDTNYTIRPIGFLAKKENEDYLAVHVKGKQTIGVYLLVFKNKIFSASMPFIETKSDNKFYAGSIDRKLSVTINEQWTEKANLMYIRTIYAYNNVGTFTTVLTETNVPPVLTTSTVINPIDTFPKKNKFSGDYVKGKKNLVSIRDGQSPNDYIFFVFFTKEDETNCGGNLKGEFKLSSSGTGVYSTSGDPCVIDFRFAKNQVTVKEQGSCGNYRGITCFFNDTYTLKKTAKATGKK